jgi:hypothetical protein
MSVVHTIHTHTLATGSSPAIIAHMVKAEVSANGVISLDSLIIYSYKFKIHFLQPAVREIHLDIQELSINENQYTLSLFFPYKP